MWLTVQIIGSVWVFSSILVTYLIFTAPEGEETATGFRLVPPKQSELDSRGENSKIN